MDHPLHREEDTVQVLVRRTEDGGGYPLPAYATSGSAGLDLRANLQEPITLPPGGRALMGTGVAVALPTGYEAQIRPRSGLAARHGVTLLNSPGTIDSDYRGEIKLILVNLGEEPFTVRGGDRIGQMVVGRVARAALREVKDLPVTGRSDGGFGHTGSS